MLTVFNGVPGNTQGQILRAVMLNTWFISVNSQEPNTLHFRQQYCRWKDLLLCTGKSVPNGLSAHAWTQKYHPTIYTQSGGHKAVPLGHAWAWGHFFCPSRKPSHPLLLLIRKVPRRKEAPEISMRSLQRPRSGEGWSLHLELSQQLSGRQVIVPGSLSRSCLTLLYLALFLKWPLIKDSSLIKNQSLRLFWPKIRLRTLGCLLKWVKRPWESIFLDREHLHKSSQL